MFCCSSSRPTWPRRLSAESAAGQSFRPINALFEIDGPGGLDIQVRLDETS
jgi:hypothetical protein